MPIARDPFERSDGGPCTTAEMPRWTPEEQPVAPVHEITQELPLPTRDCERSPSVVVRTPHRRNG